MTTRHYGAITQVAWVTDDIDATERLLNRFGAGAWTRLPDIEFGPTCEYRGTPADFTAHISLTYLGDMQLELIQPRRGVSVYSEFLERNGAGLHHVCFEPDDFDAAVQQALEDGIAVPQRGDMAGLMRFAYLDCAQAGVPYVELAEVSADMRKMFEHIKNHAHADRT